MRRYKNFNDDYERGYEEGRMDALRALDEDIEEDLDEDFERGYYDGYSEVINESGSEDALIKQALNDCKEALANDNQKECLEIVKELFKKLGYGGKTDILLKLNHGDLNCLIGSEKAIFHTKFIADTLYRFEPLIFPNVTYDVLYAGIKKAVEKHLPTYLDAIQKKLEGGEVVEFKVEGQTVKLDLEYGHHIAWEINGRYGHAKGTNTEMKVVFWNLLYGGDGKRGWAPISLGSLIDALKKIR